MSQSIEQSMPDNSSKTVFGFWVYLMTDCVLFAALFATYAVLHNNTNGGHSGGELFSLPYVLVETVLLLTSSFTTGLAMLAVRRSQTKQIIAWFGVTFLLGLAFLSMELTEFSHLVRDGSSWRTSGFLSSFFTLVGTHGLHITIGLIWMIVLLTRVIRRISQHQSGLTANLRRQLILLSLFWHFLDIIWIFIFSVVYLRGAL